MDGNHICHRSHRASLLFCAGGILRPVAPPECAQSSKTAHRNGSRAAHDGADSGNSTLGNWKNWQSFIEKWLSEQFQLPR